MSRKLEDVGGLSLFLIGMAGVAVAQEQAVHAARLCGAVAAVRDAIHAWLSNSYWTDYHHIVATARSKLDERTFTAAWAEGQAMTLEQAITYALELA